MKTLKAIYHKLSAILDDLLSMKKYVDIGALDFSGQGRNKYGK